MSAFSQKPAAKDYRPRRMPPALGMVMALDLGIEFIDKL